MGGLVAGSPANAGLLNDPALVLRITLTGIGGDAPEGVPATSLPYPQRVTSRRVGETAQRQTCPFGPS